MEQAADVMTPARGGPTRYVTLVAGYLGAIGLLVGTLFSLFGGGGHSGVGAPIWVLVSLTALPLVLYLIFDARPRYLQRRQDRWLGRGMPLSSYFLIGPREEPDPDHYSRPDGAHEEVLRWIVAARAPILHLVGASGTAKTSMLCAYVIPKLMGRTENPWQVVRIRQFTDPLLTLTEGLERLWRDPPRGFRELSVREQLERAARRKPMLLALDQFEELFILHENTSTLAVVKDLLASLESLPVPGLKVLLSYRADHKTDIDRLELSARREDPELGLRTCYDVQPFTFSAGRSFINGSGLQTPAARLDSALAEAAALDDSGNRVRPIVLNLVGRILAEMSEAGASVSTRGDLLVNYVRRHAFPASEGDLPAKVLPALITKRKTAANVTLSQLAVATGVEIGQLRRYLTRLQQPGITRILGAVGETWALSHDFVVSLVQVILSSTSRFTAQRIRTWALHTALLVAGGVTWALLMADPGEALRLAEEMKRTAESVSQYFPSDAKAVAASTEHARKIRAQVARAEALGVPELASQVSGSLDALSRLEERFRSAEVAGPAWDVALAEIARSPRYAALPLSRQFGLQPLGMNPNGLYEFASVYTGPVPLRDAATGRFRLDDDENAVIFVLVPDGSFWMGASKAGTRNVDPDAEEAEGPVHEVRVHAFLLSKYECTRSQWDRLRAGETPLGWPTWPGSWTRGEGVAAVGGMTWEEATAWTARYGFRLPTEAEWEYACRAGTATPFPCTGALTCLELMAVFGQPAGTTFVIGSKEPNPWGFHDMPGGHIEWCSDYFGPYGAEAVIDPKGPPENTGSYVRRGGSLFDEATSLRSAARESSVPGNRQTNVGLRLARTWERGR